MNTLEIDSKKLISSRYNFSIPTLDATVLLYNSLSGAVVLLSGVHSQELSKTLVRWGTEIDQRELSYELFLDLTEGGFILPSASSEIEDIRLRYWKSREQTPMVITITTTQDCNLGCYYCYEDRSTDQLVNSDVDSIITIISNRLDSGNKDRLHVDWYGGEPLLNVAFLEAASKAIQKLCKEKEIAFRASIISNGTEWDFDIGSFIERNKIKQVQISFDGLKKNHDRRRRYRSGYEPLNDEASSFDRAVKLVDVLLDHTRVDLRFNLDKKNKVDVLPFIEFAKKRGWFGKNFPAVLQPARLASYTDHSSFLRKNEIPLDDFDLIRRQIRELTENEILVEESEVPDGFPLPKNSVCAALAADSIVIGADGLKYRCGLQVGESHRSVGTIRSATRSRRELPIFAPTIKDDSHWWDSFDPTTLPNCSRCSFLPICWGGCPKKHLEMDAHAIAEQSRYWRQNLPRLIAKGVGREIPEGFSFTEDQQFRTL